MANPPQEDKNPHSNEELQKLKETLDTSSSINRNLEIIFTSFLIYVVIIIISTDDIQLLLPDSKLALPILGIQLPVIGFYLVVPALIVALHFNMLINLLEHSKKLYEYWDKAGKNSSQLYPFLFNFTVRYENGSLISKLVNGAIHISFFIIPLFVLLYLQVRFSDYQSLLFTVIHFTFLILDAFLLLIFYYQIVENENYKTKSISWVIKAKENGLLHLKKRAILNFTFFWGILIFGFFNLVIILTVSWNPIILKPIKGFISIPHLTVTDKLLVKNTPPNELLEVYYSRDTTLVKAYLELAEGINLENRNLNYAELDGNKLYKLKANYNTKMVNASLNNTDLQEAYLGMVDLQEANLFNARLQKADLSRARLQEADLRGTNLQGADLFHANLHGAELAGAIQTNSNSDITFDYILTTDTSHREAISEKIFDKPTSLQGANLMFTDFIEADLRKANFQGADLKYAHLQGADLKNAGFQGADLRGARLQGADLKDAHFQGIHLQNSDLIGITYENIQFESNYYQPINLFQPADSIIKEILENLSINDEIQFLKNIKKFGLKDIFNFQSDLDGFISFRKKMICSKDILNPSSLLFSEFDCKSDPNLIRVNRELIEHLKNTCPEKLEGIDLSKYSTE
ncbi:pentapeptide repeat-containing protein [Flammeovirgaceae bacterium SG7u.111]|nr:pentapeptide repeat-containing protein [Flammeovirgaceae bacterium SG7u.132]WPO33605.1 pentapeptide repeat-containing protein [Flammeovirgaceae bacterium SG7u.111]